MDKEVELIVKAIESLRQESNFFKDYFFPIISAFFTSLLGAGIAFFAFRHQEFVQVEKEKMNAANKWILIIEEAFTSLISIKGNYHGKLTANPVERLSLIPTMLGDSKSIDEDLSTLSFVVSKASTDVSNDTKWNQITRIRAMVNNYNTLLDIWGKRNQIERPFKEKIVADFSGGAIAEVSIEQIIKCVGHVTFASLLELNEKAIKFTDDLIVEFNDFLLNFPEVAKSLIKTKRIKQHGSVFIYSNSENEQLLDLLKKSPEVDYVSLSKLIEAPVEELKRRNDTGY